jgi:ankyrin repeat protein
MKTFNFIFIVFLSIIFTVCASVSANPKTTSVVIPDKQGGTPLFLAIFKKDEKLANTYISNGQYVNQTRSDGISPLMVASIQNNKSLVENLLHNGAEINIVSLSGKYGMLTGMSALMLASEQEGSSIVTLLLSKEADINLQDQNGTTALMYAVRANNLPAVKVLAEAGAFDYHVVDNNGNTALMIAKSKGFTEIANYLQVIYTKSITNQFLKK